MLGQRTNLVNRLGCRPGEEGSIPFVGAHLDEGVADRHPTRTRESAGAIPAVQTASHAEVVEAPACEAGISGCESRATPHDPETAGDVSGLIRRDAWFDSRGIDSRPVRLAARTPGSQPGDRGFESLTGHLGSAYERSSASRAPSAIKTAPVSACTARRTRELRATTETSCA